MKKDLLKEKYVNTFSLVDDLNTWQMANLEDIWKFFEPLIFPYPTSNEKTNYANGMHVGGLISNNANTISEDFGESPFTDLEEEELAELSDYEECELINYIDNVEDFKEYINGLDAKYSCGQTIYYKKKYVEQYLNR